MIETTYLKDSVSAEERRLFNPVVLSQRLLFLKKGKLVTIRLNRSRKIYQKVSSGQKVLMLSNVYSTAYVVAGEYKTAFAVNGNGGCNSCRETLDFYTLSGKPAYKPNSPGGWQRFLKIYDIKNYSTSKNKVIIYHKLAQPGARKAR